MIQQRHWFSIISGDIFLNHIRPCVFFCHACTVLHLITKNITNSIKDHVLHPKMGNRHWPWFCYINQNNNIYVLCSDEVLSAGSPLDKLKMYKIQVVTRYRQQARWGIRWAPGRPQGDPRWSSGGPRRGIRWATDGQLLKSWKQTSDTRGTENWNNRSFVILQ